MNLPRKIKRFARHLYMHLHEKEYILFYLMIVVVCFVVSFFMVSVLGGLEKDPFKIYPVGESGLSEDAKEQFKAVYQQMDKEDQKRIKNTFKNLSPDAINKSDRDMLKF